MRVGIVTGGGDCPGLNAVIRAVVRGGEALGHSCVGFRHGWRGVVENDFVTLTQASTRGILATGGTMLGTSRYHPDEHEGSLEQIVDTLRREGVEALIVTGGDGTLRASQKVAEHGIRIVGVPKTIDNDVLMTDRSVGFDTAVSIAADAIDRVHTTAESHDRVMVVEVMGHHAGWIAVSAGVACGADAILIPEEPFEIDEICATIRHRHRKGVTSSIVVVAEGAQPAEGTIDFRTVQDPNGTIMAGAVGDRVRAEIASRTGYESRVTVLGHVQRGGSPTAADRLLATRFGIAAIDAVDEGKSGVMTAVIGDEIVLQSLDEATQSARYVPPELRRLANRLSG